MEVGEIFDTVGGLIALAAIVGGLLLVPLYLSQRRDLRRLRAWMERDPDYASQNLAASEGRLDRAESELEQVAGATAVAEPDAPPTPAAGMPAATRVTSSPR